MRKLLLAAVLVAFSVSANAQVVPFGTLGGGSSIGSGTALSGCTSSILYATAGSLLGCNPATVVNGSVSTAARSILTISDTITGSSTTSNFLNITGAFPGTLSAETNAINAVISGDNDAQDQNGLKVSFAMAASESYTSAPIKAILTGTSNGVAGIFQNDSSTTGIVESYGVIGNVTTAGTNQARQYGVYGISSGISGIGIGVAGTSGSGPSLRSVGVLGYGDSDSSNGAIGLLGVIGPTPITIGTDITTVPTSFRAALVANNTTAALPIAIFTDNSTAVSTTAAWAGSQVVDGGQIQVGNGVLTSATMTPTITAESRTVTHSYAWTNAMVTALGAVLTGDITVATLPAKTRVNTALVVIDTAAGGVTTLTVSCGDAIGGAPFNQYIVASNAKAAANTVYGDLISGAETGTALFDATTKWFPNYVPSYTTTTLVTCRFISTGTNLNTVTTSTGRVILNTTLLP